MWLFLDFVLGIVRPISPFQWPTLIRRLRTADGWAPPMLMIATVGVLLFSGQGFGLLAGNAAARMFNYVALATWFLVGALASLAVIIDGTNNLRRLGVLGISRPRWWFELARLTWISLLFIVLSIPLIHFAAFIQLRAIGGFLFGILPVLYVAFMIFGTSGYAVSGMTGRRRRGRAFECVQYFYWLAGIIFAVTAFAMWVPAHAWWAEPLIVIACVIAASLAGIWVITMSKRPEKKATSSDEITTWQIK